MKKQKLSIFVKYSIFTTLLFLFAIESQAQSISIFDIDTTNFPIIKAKFFALDKDGKQQKPSASELKLSENGIDRKILSVTCPNPKPVKAISSVLVMDVSGSMSGSGTPGIANIDLAKQASTSWINALPTASSQCAITSFDDANYYIQDFTTDKSKLLSAINTLRPNNGTNYDAALYNSMAGGIPIAKSGKYKKVVIILTDGMPNYEPQVQTIINEANRNGIMIFAVTLGMLCPDNLKEITTKTGGFWYENVTTVDNARQIYFTIMNNVNNGEPCEITWESDVTCSNGINIVELKYNTINFITSYETVQKGISKLQVYPNYIAFEKRIPFTQNDTTITITTQNADFTISGINRKFGSTDFSIINSIFPIQIAKNASKNITLRYTPSDTSKNYVSFEIESDKCLANFSANGGYPGVKSKSKTIKLTNPNGGETFVVGSDTMITWTGVSSSDTVSLEYSTNKGNVWIKITDSATNLKYNWTKIKPPSSIECLLRVKQYTINNKHDTNAIFTLKGHSDVVLYHAYSLDGRQIATTSLDNTAKIWNANTGALLHTLVGHINAIKYLSYSPDGRKIATASKDGSVKVWDASSGALLLTISRHLYGVNYLSYNPDGSHIATAGFDNTAIIQDANTGALLHTLAGHFESVTHLSYNPDGSQITTSSEDKTAKIWNANTGALIHTLTGHKL